MLVVERGLVFAVHVVAALAHAGFAVSLEGLLDLVEMVGFRAEMAETIIACLGRFCGSGAERHAVEAVQAVALQDCRPDFFAAEDILEGLFYRGGACAGRTGDSNYGVLARHDGFSWSRTNENFISSDSITKAPAPLLRLHRAPRFAWFSQIACEHGKGDIAIMPHSKIQAPTRKIMQPNYHPASI